MAALVIVTLQNLTLPNLILHYQFSISYICFSSVALLLSTISGARTSYSTPLFRYLIKLGARCLSVELPKLGKSKFWTANVQLYRILHIHDDLPCFCSGRRSSQVPADQWRVQQADRTRRSHAEDGDGSWAQVCPLSHPERFNDKFVKFV